MGTGIYNQKPTEVGRQIKCKCCGQWMWPHRRIDGKWRKVKLCRECDREAESWLPAQISQELDR